MSFSVVLILDVTLACGACALLFCVIRKTAPLEKEDVRLRDESQLADSA